MKVLISALLLTISMTFIQLQANAQNSSVAIGDATPKSNAVLYLKSPGGNQGLIIPIVKSPGSFGEVGMIVYGSDDGKVFYHNGTDWTAVGGGSGGTYTLSLSGNNLILKDASSTVSTVPVAATAPSAANQFLTWDGSKWIATTFTQDAANVNGAITVNGIKGKTLPALPSTTQALVYNGTAWVFQALTGGTDSQDLTLNTTTNILSLTNDATTVDLSVYKQTLSTSGTGTVANGESFPVALSSSGGTVTIKEGSNVQIDQAANVLTINSVAGGSGTVTNVSVTSANGVSGTVANPTTTPAVTLSLGAITPTSVAATGTVTGSNISGTNTGDNAVNTLYSGLVTNATHTGDATGATALTVKGINNVLLSGLGTGVLKNTTGTGAPSIATGADLPVMTATVGGAVPTPPNNTTTFLRGDGTFATPAGGGTLTAVSVTTANGFSGTSSGGSTPAITLTTPVTGILKGNGTSMAAALNSDLPAMTATVGGAVPTPPNNTTTFLRGDGTFATPAGGGTLTAVSVTTANGFSGTSSGGSTPAITLTTPVTGILKGNGTSMAAALNSDLPAMTATVGGAVPTPPNNTTTFLRGDGTFATPAGGGTVTAVTVATANGFSGTSSGGATPALTLTTPLTGLLKGNGTAMSVAVAGTDYLTPTGSAAGLTAFPILNQNTTGTAASITGNITESQVTNLTTDLGNKVTANGAIIAGTNTKITYDSKGLVTAGAALTASDLPVMTATVGGAVPTPPNNTTTFLRGDGTFAAPAAGMTNPLTTTGDIIYGVGSTPTRLAGAAGVLKSTGAAAPAWGAVNLATADVTGILPVANGGTGGTTWNGLLLGSGSTIGDITTGTSGQILKVAGTTPTWTNFAVTSADITDGQITGADLATNISIATTGNITTNAPGSLSIAGTSTLTGAATLTTLAGAGTRMVVANPTGVLSTQALPTSGWGLTGNATTVDGTNFIGTTDAVPLTLRVNNQVSGRIESASGTANALYGYQAGNVNTGIQNSAVGYQAMLSNTSGQRNAAFGYQAMSGNTTGNGNTAAGQSALSANTTGGANTALGTRALANNTASNNTAVGNNALATNTSAGDNAAVGVLSLSANTASSNSALGAYSLQSNTTGTGNAGVGYNALISNTTGSQNTSLGSLSGYTAIPANANTTGSANTFLGYASGPGVATQLTNATAIGANALVSVSNALVLGGTGANAVDVGIGVTAPTEALDVVGNLKFSGAIMPNNIPGTSGQVLISAGSGAAPTWGNISGTALATNNVIPKGNGTAQVASQLFDNGTNVGIGTVTPAKKLDVSGDINISTGSSLFVNSVRMFNATGSNTSLGSNAGIATTASANTFFGFDAGRANTTGTYNLHVGRGAGVNSTTASYNVFVGPDAGATLVTGGLNTFVGFNAGFASDGAISNTFVGNKAGLANTSADYNTFIGERSAEFNTTGAENTFVGRTTGATNTTGLQNTLIGANANVAAAGLQNATAIGYKAYAGANNSLVLGSINGLNGATVNTNVGIGTSTPTFRLEVAGGDASINGVTIGMGGGNQPTNVAIGGLSVNTTGTENTAVGYNTLTANSGASAVWNTAVGSSALAANSSGQHNAAFGQRSLLTNTSGSDNAGLGTQSLYNNTTGSGNTAVGTIALSTNGGGSENTAIGHAADVSSASLTNSTAIGSGAIVNASNKVRVGNSAVTVIEGQVAFTAASDRRFKKDIKDIDEGLDFISKLRPVSYRMKDGDNRINWGFIAQDIESLVGTENAVLTIGGDSNRSLGLRYTDFVAPLVKSIQEQQNQIEELKKVIQDLEAKLKVYQNNENAELAVIREQIKKLSEAVGMEASTGNKK